MSNWKPLPVSRKSCETRIADAKAMGWEALAQSWQRDLDKLSPKAGRAEDPFAGRRNKQRKD